MRFLLDTNVLIKLHPDSAESIEPGAATAARLSQLLGSGGHHAFAHPAVSFDIDRTVDEARRDLNRFRVSTYPRLPNPPSSAAIATALGNPVEGSNDWVDMQLIASVQAGAVQYLVTEDFGLLRRMRRVSLERGGLRIAEAVDLLESLFDHDVRPPPVVTATSMYSLDWSDPIWETFRGEYRDFDKWFDKARGDGRPSWYIQGSSGYSGICIAKAEDDRPHGLDGRILKVCSFKVADEARGSKYGELLLKTVLRYASENRRNLLYVEVLPRHGDLIEFLEDFGFAISSGHSTSRGELVLVKTLVPEATVAASLSEFEFHRKYGPPAIHPNARIFVVPIRAKFHRMLFPDEQVGLERRRARVRLPLDVPPLSRAFGNAIKKAYLSNGPIRSLEPGDILAFYRSEDHQAVTTVGVVEDTFVGKDPVGISAFVGPRTVYSFEEVESMSRQRAVLAILFRHDRSVEPMELGAMMSRGALRGAPQSITRVRKEGLDWMRSQLIA